MLGRDHSAGDSGGKKQQAGDTHVSCYQGQSRKVKDVNHLGVAQIVLWPRWPLHSHLGRMCWVACAGTKTRYQIQQHSNKCPTAGADLHIRQWARDLKLDLNEKRHCRFSLHTTVDNEGVATQGPRGYGEQCEL
ncbi:hypothetical protein NDU88_007039 [Pleurodeles waltl]|uniref:Uncharacterized protein n=1 Tax=Pleurodeles waltl TaxID=8319 RepID=A0AAV7NUT9_PLEWA|nr:hypothetical protein NDU88_007039 [Pleurodeles waltl]